MGPLSMRKSMPKSVPYNVFRGCPSGYHKRSSYKSPRGLLVPARCVRATTIYKESSAQFKARTLKRVESRRRRAHIPVRATRKCPPGEIRRTGYVRRYSTGIRRRGYTVRRRDGVAYRVYPEASRMIVRSSCIKDRGLPGKGPRLFPKLFGGTRRRPSVYGIGPLRKGELTKHGYSTQKSSGSRHAALRKAVKEFGALGVYRKLNAVAKLGVRSAKTPSKTFKADRNWVRNTYGPLKAF
jgi:hypothetical protein